MGWNLKKFIIFNFCPKIEFFIIFFYLTARSLLNWRALNTSIRAINTTISIFRFKFIFAIRTLPNILTIISRHLFGSLLMTLQTRNCWLELNVSHILNPETCIEIVISFNILSQFEKYLANNKRGGFASRSPLPLLL